MLDRRAVDLGAGALTMLVVVVSLVTCAVIVDARTSSATTLCINKAQQFVVCSQLSSGSGAVAPRPATPARSAPRNRASSGSSGARTVASSDAGVESETSQITAGLVAFGLIVLFAALSIGAHGRRRRMT